jgi:hypothetical protein
MRPDGSDGPRVAVYLATPDSPDYEALRRGIDEAQRAGLDVANIDAETILSRSVIGRVQDALEGKPRQRGALTKILDQPEKKVDEWLRANVRDNDIFYLYRVPEDLNAWRQSSTGFKKAFGIGTDTEADGASDPQMAASIRNNFSPEKDHRYYLQESDIHILETDYPDLLNGDETTRLSVSYGPSYQSRAAHSAYGTVESVVDIMEDMLADDERFYATISAESTVPKFSFQMLYQGSATKPVITAAVRNADAIATTLNERLTD